MSALAAVLDAIPLPLLAGLAIVAGWFLACVISAVLGLGDRRP